MKYEEPKMDIIEYDVRVALTVDSPMENWGTGEGDEIPLS